jgi:hypothetical protein
MEPHKLDSVRVIPGVRIHEGDRVIHCAMRVTMRCDILIRSPAITDEHCAGFDPSTDTRCGNKETGFML